jgi:hypothetical protein
MRVPDNFVWQHLEMNQMKESIEELELGSEGNWKYWLAVNRDSVTASPVPLPAYPTVVPTPQMLVGFDTIAEQAKYQHFLLFGRLDSVKRFTGTTLPKLAREGKVVVKLFKYPQKPTRSGTCWSYDG